MPLEVEMVPFAAFLKLCLVSILGKPLNEMLLVGKQKSCYYAAFKPFFLFCFDLEI